MNLNNRNIRVSLTPSCNFKCDYCDGATTHRSENKPGAMEDYRSTPLSYGNISTDTYMKIIKILHDVGFGGIALTGGEPMLNKNWDSIADYSREIGMNRVNMTTNGMLLKRYIEKKGKLPSSLSLLNISLDTIDETEFRRISGGKGNLQTILEGLNKVKISNPNLFIRANKVGLRSYADQLVQYIEFCERTGVIDEINLLSLIRKSSDNHDFFQKEYISAEEIIEIIQKSGQFKFTIDDRLEYITKSKQGLGIIIKDSNKTIRSEECNSCKMYCQEGFYTLRVATDGTIMACPDYSASSSPVGIVRIPNNIININDYIPRIKRIVEVLIRGKESNTMNSFINKHNLILKK